MKVTALAALAPCGLPSDREGPVIGFSLLIKWLSHKALRAPPQRFPQKSTLQRA